MFQSSPAPRDGRYYLVSSLECLGMQVSILARPEGRVLPKIAKELGMEPDVSILARPEGRALPRNCT